MECKGSSSPGSEASRAALSTMAANFLDISSTTLSFAS